LRSFEKTTNVAVQDARVGPEAEKLFAEAKEMLVGNPGCFPAVTHPYIYIYRWYFDISNGMVICQNIPSI